jgi:hypothetical protein
MEAGSLAITPLKDQIEICALHFGDFKELLRLKPVVPTLSDREWILLTGRFGIRGAYAHCFIEYWKCKFGGGKTMNEIFAEWLAVSKIDPSHAPLTEFVI